MVKHYGPSEHQTSVAWFKLSELVARGERERAFSIFRLLTHALNDDAYATQLKGDLWYAFNEYDRAREAYYSAIAWYDFSERPYQAAFMHERLAMIEHDSLALRITMITRFAELSYNKHVTRYMNELFTLAHQQNQLETCVTSIKEIDCSPQAYTILQGTMKHSHNSIASQRASLQAETHLTL